MKNTIKTIGILILALVFAFSMLACDMGGGGGKGGGGGGGNQIANPGDVFGVKFTNLEGKNITIEFFAGADQAAFKNRLKGVFTHLDTYAGSDSAFKTKINAALAKGLTIVIENVEDYGAKAVGGKLYIDTGEFDNSSDSSIANGIIILINSGGLAKAKQQFNNMERQKGFVELAAARQKAGITI